MLNHMIMIGRLCADPELRYTQSGTPVASFTLAVDRMHKASSGERETDFIPVVVWQKLAEVVAQHLRKGRLAAVVGRLQIRSYENKDGQKVRIAELVASEVQFLDRAPSGEASTPNLSAKESAEKESPFRDDPFAKDAMGGDLTDDDLPF